MENQEDLYSIIQEWGDKVVSEMKLKLLQSGTRDGNLTNSLRFDAVSGQFEMEYYGQYIDLGTWAKGPFSLKPPTPNTPQYNKTVAGMAHGMELWANQRGLNEWAVAKSILRKGGLSPRHFFSDTIEENIDLLAPLVGDAIIEYIDGRIMLIASTE